MATAGQALMALNRRPGLLPKHRFRKSLLIHENMVARENFQFRAWIFLRLFAVHNVDGAILPGQLDSFSGGELIKTPRLANGAENRDIARIRLFSSACRVDCAAVG